MRIKGKNGYYIYYNEIIPKNCKKIIIAMHGFAGDKLSTCISMLEDNFCNKGIGLIKFDWPAHGESKTNILKVNKALNDLDSIVEYIKSKNKDVDLIGFGTSFGGYLTLLYNYYHRDVFKHLILRSPAIRMYDLIKIDLEDDKKRKEMDKYGYYIEGYDRLLKVSKYFINELKENDLIKLYKDEKLNNISIIHGTVDDVVPYEDSVNFCNIHDCKLYTVEGADHRYKKPGELGIVMNITDEILKGIK